MNYVTVLISSVGRQVSLVEQFKAALPPNGRVIAMDNDPLAVGTSAADMVYVSPRIDNAGYIEWVLSLCKRESVKLFISLLPEELLVLEVIRRELKGLGVQLIGMPRKSLISCIDKRHHDELCKNTGFVVPPIWAISDIDRIHDSEYPLIVKRVSGSGSRGVYRLFNRIEALRLIAYLEAVELHEDYLLQPCLAGQEYGLDLVNDFNGNPMATLARKKLRMRDGETEIADTINDPALDAAGRALARKLKHQGLVDCDVIKCGDVIYLLDINARFGGGYVFSHRAGANIPSAMLAWLGGRDADPGWLAQRVGVRSSRMSCLQSESLGDKKIVIITTANHKIGMGHAVRELALARMVRTEGFYVIVITDSEIVAQQAEMLKIDVVIKSLDDNRSLDEFVKSQSPDLVVIDVYERDFPRFEWLGSLYRTLLVVSREGYGFALYGQTVIYVGEDYRYWEVVRKINKTTIYSGRAFSIFRNEFNTKSLPLTEDRKQKILIAHGGADPYGLTIRSLKALELIDRCYDVTVLIGMAFKDELVIKREAESSKHRCEVVIGASNVAQYMAEASIAVINGGNTRYELCVMKTPFVAMSIDESQLMYTEQLASMGVGVSLGLITKISDLDIAQAVEDLMGDMSARSIMAKKMESLFDLRGVERILKVAL